MGRLKGSDLLLPLACWFGGMLPLLLASPALWKLLRFSPDMARLSDLASDCLYLAAGPLALLSPAAPGDFHLLLFMATLLFYAGLAGLMKFFGARRRRRHGEAKRGPWLRWLVAGFAWAVIPAAMFHMGV